MPVKAAFFIGSITQKKVESGFPKNTSSWEIEVFSVNPSNLAKL